MKHGPRACSYSFLIIFSFLKQQLFSKSLSCECKLFEIFIVVGHDNFANNDDIQIIERLSLVINKLILIIDFKFTDVEHDTSSKLIQLSKERVDLFDFIVILEIVL